MKRFLKKYFIFIIGVLVLLSVVFAFFTVPRGENSLETGVLKHWRAASTERRVAAVRVLAASDDNLDKIVACVDKMAELPDSGDMAVRDAVELCFIGYQLRENI
ncbi:MAG: hypothetical protein J6T57_04485 [Alphaproteobacteria bacterium]|nr:hypothetical protein [Alphaproteobacteria bacterium]